jgi:hypothetical protein
MSGAQFVLGETDLAGLWRQLTAPEVVHAV